MDKIFAGYYIRPHIIFQKCQQGNFCDLVVTLNDIIPGISVGIQRQGLIIASFETQLIPAYKKSNVANVLKSEASSFILDFFNALSFALYDANLAFYKGAYQSIAQEVLLEDIYLWETSTDGNIITVNKQQAIPIETGKYFTFDESVIKLEKTIGKLADSDLNFRIDMNTEIFDKFIEKRLFSEELRKKIALTNRGIIAMTRGSFDSALVSFWTVIESLIKEIWQVFITTKKVSKERMDFLTGRDLTASIMSENLELHGLISDDLYIKIKQTRKARNKLMHELAFVSPSILNHAYQSIEELIEIQYKIHIQKRVLIFMGDIEYLREE